MLEREIEVGVPAERAFAVWTQQMGLWWPPSLSISMAPGARMSFEPQAAGRMLERAPDGPEIHWARVVDWRPPSCVTLGFVPGGGGRYTSRVDLEFLPHGEGTRLRLCHGLGEFTPNRWGSMVGRFEHTWNAALPAFKAHAEGTDLPTSRPGDTLF